MKVNILEVVRIVVNKAPGTYNTRADIAALEQRVREYLWICDAVSQLESEADQALHDSIMEDIDPFGQG